MYQHVGSLEVNKMDATLSQQSLKNNATLNDNNIIQLGEDQALRDIFSYYKEATANNENDVNNVFATVKDFEKAHALPWRTLPEGTIFYISHIKQITVVGNRPAIILYLYEKDSNVEHVYWSCSLLTKDLMAMSNLQNLYVRNTGLKKSISTNRNYHSFQLIQK